jgi:hypothetical protein
MSGVVDVASVVGAACQRVHFAARAEPRELQPGFSKTQRLAELVPPLAAQLGSFLPSRKETQSGSALQASLHTYADLSPVRALSSVSAGQSSGGSLAGVYQL